MLLPTSSLSPFCLANYAVSKTESFLRTEISLFNKAFSATNPYTWYCQATTALNKTLSRRWGALYRCYPGTCAMKSTYMSCGMHSPLYWAIRYPIVVCVHKSHHSKLSWGQSIAEINILVMVMGGRLTWFFLNDGHGHGGRLTSLCTQYVGARHPRT